MSKRKKAAESDPYRTQAIEQVAGAGPSPELIPPLTEPSTLQLIQEHLEVSKQWVEAGAVVIRKTVETAPVTVPVELAHEEIEVQRVPAERVLAEGEAALPRQEGNTLIIPVVEEELVVVKRRVVREEWRITKQQVTERQEVRDTVRRERLQLDTTGGIEFVSDEGVQDDAAAPGL